MKRILSFATIVALFVVLAIGYGNGKLSACGLDSTENLTKAAYSQEMTTEKLENVNLKVKGMTCGMCEGKIMSELAKLSEVKDSEVNWEKGTAVVKVTQGSNHNALADAVKRAGFKVSSIECECGG
jgi:Cu2+-exporting ATPase